ncbi:hypothetical protein [Pedobacter nutrimenti]|uniref:Uncharacterized protein n=1 Tax=Pedobacter nutrimenti TaxID=1241337 RepID=A0A318UM85_9SPHI|nr:hypothetical protein [Pedobacter nutrimenti]PYF70588.1 hypothetical protein B0O44_10814 [Pedobacter nutrimenti]
MAISASSGQIYGLLNGFEDAIDHELEMIGFVTQDEINGVGKILDEFFLDESKMANFKGFYDLEHKFSKIGVDRGQANKILRYYYADGSFEELIDEINTSDSPSESRTFNLRDYDK